VVKQLARKKSEGGQGKMEVGFWECDVVDRLAQKTFHDYNNQDKRGPIGSGRQT